MIKNPRNIIWNASFSLFVVLLVLSFGYYSQAQDNSSAKNFFQDTDGDGLSNEEELSLGTKPDVADTDGDGYSDGVELESGYNPLKPAPGDRVVDLGEVSSSGISATSQNSANLTQKTSTQIASIVKDVVASGNSDASLATNDIKEAVQKALDESSAEIVLPEVDLKDIKVKKLPKGLGDSERADQEKKDVLEYLTMMSYVLFSNSPVQIQGEGEIEKVATKITNDSISALNLGDFDYLDTLETQGKKFLAEIQDVEVPESMVDTHVKALQLALYAASLKSELKNSQSDPLGQVAAYGKVQAFFAEITAFSEEIRSKLTGFGIADIPLNL